MGGGGHEGKATDALRVPQEILGTSPQDSTTRIYAHLSQYPLYIQPHPGHPRDALAIGWASLPRRGQHLSGTLVQHISGHTPSRFFVLFERPRALSTVEHHTADPAFQHILGSVYLNATNSKKLPPPPGSGFSYFTQGEAHTHTATTATQLGWTTTFQTTCESTRLSFNGYIYFSTYTYIYIWFVCCPRAMPSSNAEQSLAIKQTI